MSPHRGDKRFEISESGSLLYTPALAQIAQVVDQRCEEQAAHLRMGAQQ
jgi:hypothetical protein